MRGEVEPHRRRPGRGADHAAGRRRALPASWATPGARPTPCARSAWPRSSRATTTRPRRPSGPRWPASREVGDRRGEAWALQHLAWISFIEGRPAEAEGRLTRSADTFAELGDVGGLGWALGLLAFVCFIQGDLDRADELGQQVLTEAHERGDRWGEGMMLQLAAGVRCWSGRTAEALDYARESHALFADIGDRFGQAQSLATLGRALVAAGSGGRGPDHPERGPRRQPGRSRVQGPHHAGHRPGRARPWPSAIPSWPWRPSSGCATSTCRAWASGWAPAPSSASWPTPWPCCRTAGSTRPLVQLEPMVEAHDLRASSPYALSSLALARAVAGQRRGRARAGRPGGRGAPGPPTSTGPWPPWPPAWLGPAAGDPACAPTSWPRPSRPSTPPTTRSPRPCCGWPRPPCSRASGLPTPRRPATRPRSASVSWAWTLRGLAHLIGLVLGPAGRV